MTNCADPDQLASEEVLPKKPTDLDLYLQRKGISRFSRTRVKILILLQENKNKDSMQSDEADGKAKWKLHIFCFVYTTQPA